ncbi:UNVERIFIED_ORG: DNA-binding GntR family transcriptional regulator [Arthrobacter globiformis]|nr:DNA-binding GntR family transcriptional regulator [Arthrobacter globiformis]
MTENNHVLHLIVLRSYSYSYDAREGDVVEITAETAGAAEPVWFGRTPEDESFPDRSAPPANAQAVLGARGANSPGARLGRFDGIGEGMNQEMDRRGALEELRRRITSGRLAPGSHLVETTLTAEFGLSRTPIRAVLRTLADEGLVVAEPHRGAFVAEWTSRDVADMMSIRAMLEGHAASLAAERRTAEQLADMRRLCELMDEIYQNPSEGFRAKISRHNHEFHLAIFEAAASPKLYSIGTDLRRGPVMSGTFQYYSHDELGRSLQDHWLMISAIERQDGPLARSLMETHLRTAYAALTKSRTADSPQQP